MTAAATANTSGKVNSRFIGAPKRYEANKSTGLLVDEVDVGKTKSRVVASRLENLGFQTRTIERAFDTHTKRTTREPGLALAGFDDPAPRRELEDANFARIIDAGLGAGVHHYQEIALHTFPSALRSRGTPCGPPV